jgi:hypothetical protein
MSRLKMYVASVCFKCLRCFINILQVFHTVVAKIEREVASTRMLQASVPNVSSVFSDVYCNCVYLDVVYV